MSKTIDTVGLRDMPQPTYKYITTTEEALKYLEFIEKHPIIEVDTETTGLDPFLDKIVLLQIGVGGQAFVFDVREGNVNTKIFKQFLEDNDHLKLLQNTVFDYKMLKTNFNIELNRIYDTMLAEQLLYLGLHVKTGLDHLVSKYLHMNMPKTAATSFTNYHQKYEEYQLRYAANDVVVLREIYNQQLTKLKQDGLLRAAKLEFDFVSPLAEMELNGMLLDLPQWYVILNAMMLERDKLRIQLSEIFNRTVNQTTLFGVTLMNLDSPIQLVKSLSAMGIKVNSTNGKELRKYAKNPIIKLLLEYRKYEKFITTYGEKMIERIHPSTGRLHTTFRQMVDTGRMSSLDPNLQNIPKEQRYRSCFIARPGYKLITCDMSQAELRILADYSKDSAFLEAYNTGQDLHIRTAADVFGLTLEIIKQDEQYKKDGDERYIGYRNKTKAINFGLCYGITKIGLALRLDISEKDAQELIDRYFNKYKKIKLFLDNTGKSSVIKRFSTTISGRRRYYNLPGQEDVVIFNRVKGSVERQGKNHPIQGSNADTIKQSMVFVKERIKPYDARLLLTVHDEVVVEVREDQADEVAKVVSGCLIDGFGEFFHTVKMEADALIGDCWLKG